MFVYQCQSSLKISDSISNSVRGNKRLTWEIKTWLITMTSATTFCRRQIIEEMIIMIILFYENLPNEIVLWQTIE